MALRDEPRFEFIIRDSVYNWTKELLLIERTETETFWINIEKTEPDGTAMLRRTKVQPHEPVMLKPFFQLPQDIAVPFLKALAKALDQSHIERPSESKLEGKLEAIEAHLRDMRTLVFEGGKHGS